MRLFRKAADFAAMEQGIQETVGRTRVRMFACCLMMKETGAGLRFAEARSLTTSPLALLAFSARDTVKSLAKIAKNAKTPAGSPLSVESVQSALPIWETKGTFYFSLEASGGEW